MSDIEFHVAGSLDTARRLCQSEVSLPMHPYLMADEVLLSGRSLQPLREAEMNSLMVPGLQERSQSGAVARGTGD